MPNHYPGTKLEQDNASLRARLLTLEQALSKIIDAADLIDLESAIHDASALLAASQGREPERTDDEPSVLGAGDGPAPMPSRAEAEAAWRRTFDHIRHPFRGQIGGDRCLDCGQFSQHPNHRGREPERT